MRVGMLWFDDDPQKALAQKVREAAAYYRRKYGEPNICFVPPQALPQGSLSVAGVRVLPLATVPPEHLWLGVEEPGRAEGCAQKSSQRQVEGQKAL